MRRFSSRISCLLFGMAGLAAAGCAHDPYEERANLIKDRVDVFYASLKANRVEAAVHANEEIEAMADRMGETVRKQARLHGTTQAEREFALMKTAREAAAENWLALGQYFAIKRQYPQARAAYQRIIDSYTNPAERPYRDQAGRAVKDLDMLSPAAIR